MYPTEGGREVAQLTSLRLTGWKSIRDAKIELRPLNVLIGANGAGKSNLVSFFKLMNEITEALTADSHFRQAGFTALLLETP